jgi:hypothetical protein
LAGFSGREQITISADFVARVGRDVLWLLDELEVQSRNAERLRQKLWGSRV